MFWGVVFLMPALSQSLSCNFLDTVGYSTSNSHKQDAEIFKEFARFVDHKMPQIMLEFARQRASAEYSRQRARTEYVRFGSAEDIGREEAQARPAWENETQEDNDNHIDITISDTRIDVEMTESSVDTEKESDELTIIQSVVGSLKKLVNKIQSNNLSPESVKNIFKGIVNGVKEIIPTSISGEQDESTDSTTTTSTTTTAPTTPLTSTTFNPSEFFDASLSYFAQWPNICKMLWFPYHTEKCGEARCMACAPAMMASAQVCRLLEGRVTKSCIFDTLEGEFCNFCIRKYVQN